MPHAKSCKKRLITSKARNERNRQNRAMMRAKIRDYRAGIGGKSDEEKALEVGADLYMSKPFDDEIVLQVIQDVFEGRLVSRQGSNNDGPVVHYQRAGAA